MWTHRFSKTLIVIGLALSLAISVPASPPAKNAEAAQAKDTIRTIQLMAEVTSYSSDPLETDDTPDITASGSHVHQGTLACPYRYAFGTAVWVKGKRYICEDRMNRKYPDRFDVWSPTKEAATEWGLQKISISIEQ